MLLKGSVAEDVQRAARHLAAGELLGFPTETVYGLGARADDDAAVARIFEAKGRPADHPLIVHVFERDDAIRFAPALGESAERLVASLWPGPLTVIVQRAEGVAHAAAGGQSTIGLRCPSHPISRAVLAAARELGVFGVAAPSANRFGRVSPTTAQHVVSEFGSELLVLDGGDCEVGIESSIVDCSRAQPVLLRPGVLTRAELEDAVGARLLAPDAEAPKASGTLAAHYAPRAHVRLLSAEELLARLRAAAVSGVMVYARASLLNRAKVEVEKGALFRLMPGNARATAHELFSVLRAGDDGGVEEIWIESPPEHSDWDGVRDRLSRAAAAFLIGD